VFLDFARAPKLGKTHTNILVLSLWMHRHIDRIHKKSFLLVQLISLDFARVFLDFATAPAAYWGGSKSGVSTGTCVILPSFGALAKSKKTLAKSNKFGVLIWHYYFWNRTKYRG